MAIPLTFSSIDTNKTLDKVYLIMFILLITLIRIVTFIKGITLNEISLSISGIVLIILGTMYLIQLIFTKIGQPKKVKR